MGRPPGAGSGGIEAARALGFSVVPFIATLLPWYWGFWIPAAGVTLFGVLTLAYVVDRRALTSLLSARSQARF